MKKYIFRAPVGKPAVLIEAQDKDAAITKLKWLAVEAPQLAGDVEAMISRGEGYIIESDESADIFVIDHLRE